MPGVRLGFAVKGKNILPFFTVPHSTAGFKRLSRNRGAGLTVRMLTGLIVFFRIAEDHRGDGRVPAAAAAEGEGWSRGWVRF